MHSLFRFGLVLVTLGGTIRPATATPPRFTKLVPSDLTEGLHFGPVAMRENVIAVGATHMLASPGRAYVFVAQPSQSFREIAVLTPSDGKKNDHFGSAVAVGDGFVAVGAMYHDGHRENTGAVYIFEPGGSGWRQTAKLKPPRDARDDDFGENIAAGDDFVVVGASTYGYGRNVGIGAAFVFERQADGDWRRTARLEPERRSTATWFGSAVAADEDQIAVGEMGYRGHGAVAVFARGVDGGFTRTATLVPNERGGVCRFGRSVAIKSDVVVVGDNGYPKCSAGAVYVFSRGTDGNFAQTAVLRPDGVAKSVHFGHAVAIGGNGAIVVGAPNHRTSMPQPGAAYLFKEEAGGWQLTARLFAREKNARDYFGETVAASTQHVLVGAQGEDVSSLHDVGAAYLFDLGAPADVPPGADKGGPLRVALSGNYSPLHFPQGGRMAGLEADLAQLIGQALNREVVFINPRPHSGTLAAVANGHADLGMSSITPTPQRRKLVDFTMPYLALQYRFAGGSECRAPGFKNQLAEMSATVAVVRGLAAEVAHRALPNAEIVVEKSWRAAVQAVLTGRASCLLGEDVGLLLAIADQPLRLKGVAIAPSPLAIAVPKGAAEQHNRVLIQLEEDIGELVRKWQPGVPPDAPELNQAGLLCDLYGTRVPVRAKPDWGAAVIARPPCGVRVSILSHSRNRDDPRDGDRFCTGAVGGFRDFWYRVRLESSKKTGWVFAGVVFRLYDSTADYVHATPFELIDSRLTDSMYFGLALDLYQPAESGPELDDKIALPFIYRRGQPGVIPFVPPTAEKDLNTLLLPDELQWLPIVSGSGGAAGITDVEASSRPNNVVKLTIRFDINYQEGGADLSCTAHWQAGWQRAEIERCQ